MFVKPVDGRFIPDPYRNDQLPLEGRNVDAGQYWWRLIRDGEVVEVKPALPAVESHTEEV